MLLTKLKETVSIFIKTFMKRTSFILTTIILTFINNYSKAQIVDPDRAAFLTERNNANNISNTNQTFSISQSVVNKNNAANTYQNVGSFRVSGSQYYKYIALPGKVYKAGNIISYDKVMYDTYMQQLMFKTPVDNGLLYDANLVDSFIISKNFEEKIVEDMHFISGELIDGKQKGFYQKIVSNGKQTLYKAIKTTIELPTDSYAKKDFREFVEASSYYYSDNTTAVTSFKKIKLSKNWLRSNFITHTNAINFLENNQLTENEDNFIKTFFILL